MRVLKCLEHLVDHWPCAEDAAAGDIVKIVKRSFIGIILAAGICTGIFYNTTKGWNPYNYSDATRLKLAIAFCTIFGVVFALAIPCAVRKSMRLNLITKE